MNITVSDSILFIYMEENKHTFSYLMPEIKKVFISSSSSMKFDRTCSKPQVELKKFFLDKIISRKAKDISLHFLLENGVILPKNITIFYNDIDLNLDNFLEYFFSVQK
ncbi:hypothetical protein DERP_005104 [Dermatophagoides pteronyssinus]|uniref:Uncharacterized protein n=1 Tax=Dermatophagoides pteronyssinus TaxID=6956 RepID=A0ABQ8JTD4_DERPT|nr:hypothetical protein DERP_005104 [Dermatophagoides pteronyssinus]